MENNNLYLAYLDYYPLFELHHTTPLSQILYTPQTPEEVSELSFPQVETEDKKTEFHINGEPTP